MSMLLQDRSYFQYPAKSTRIANVANEPHAGRPPAPELSECGRWLRVNFAHPHVIKSWAVLGGGTGEARSVIWRQVTDGELSPGVDPRAYLIEQVAAHFSPDEASRQVIGFLTGASLATRTEAFLGHSGIWVRCIATAGLNNALRIGDPPSAAARRGAPRGHHQHPPSNVNSTNRSCCDGGAIDRSGGPHGSGTGRQHSLNRRIWLCLGDRY